MTSLSSIWTNLLQLIASRGHWRVAPRYFLNVSSVALKATRSWERRRVRNFNGRQGRRFLRRQFPMMVILSFLALPVSIALADILYVSHLNFDGHISVVDTLTGTVDIIPLNLQSEVPPPLRASTCIALTEDGTKAYVSILDGDVFPDVVVVIDVASKMATDTIKHSDFGHPCVAISGTRVYLSTDGDKKIIVIDTDNPLDPSPPVIDTSSVNVFPGELVLGPNGSTLYALPDFFSPTSSVIQIAGLDGPGDPTVSRFQFDGSIASYQQGLDVRPDGSSLFATLSSGGTVEGRDLNPSAFDPDLGTFTSSEKPVTGGVAITPNGEFAYVALSSVNKVIVIDIQIFIDTKGQGEIVVSTINVGNPGGTFLSGLFPRRIAMSPDGIAYVTNTSSGIVTVIDTTTSPPAVIDTIDVGGNPLAIAIQPSVTEPPVASLDSFQCLAARKLHTPRRYTYKKFGGITYLRFKSNKRKEPESFCGPVDVNGEGINDDTAHLTCYEKEHWKYSKFFKHSEWRDNRHRRHMSDKQTVNVTNMFGDQTLRIRDPEAICVTSEIDGTPSTSDLGRFMCFEARRGTEFVKTEVTIGEQTWKVKKPVSICRPVDEKGVAIEGATDHLTCYTIKKNRSHRSKYSKYRKWSSWKHRHRSSSEKVTVNNEFGDGQNLRISDPETLCVPSTILIVQSPPPRTYDDDKDDDDDDHKKKSKMDDDDDD